MDPNEDVKLRIATTDPFEEPKARRYFLNAVGVCCVVLGWVAVDRAFPAASVYSWTGAVVVSGLVLLMIALDRTHRELVQLNKKVDAIFSLVDDRLNLWTGEESCRGGRGSATNGRAPDDAVDGSRSRAEASN